MKKYIFQADIVRALAILLAVGVHIVIPITARPDFFGGKIWWLTFLLNCLFRIGVPLFVILSGYLNLGKEVSLEENNKKVVKRLFIPLVSFYIIFNLAYMAMAYLRKEYFDYWGIFHNLSKNTHTTLYFLVILFFIQLLNPLWNLMTEKKNQKVLKYVTRFFLLLAATAYVFYYVSLREGEVFSTYTLWIMWVGYYLYGYVVKTKGEYLTKKESVFYWTMFITGYFLTVIGGYVTLYLFHNGLSDLFYIGGQSYSDAYLGISVMMMAMSGFNLIMRSRKAKSLEKYFYLKKIVVFMAKISFPLYLIHLLVMDVLSKFFGIYPDSQSMPGLLQYLLINTVLTFAISIPLAWGLKKTKFLNKIIGG